MFDYSFRRQRSCLDLHEDEVVILNSELATQFSIRYGNCLCICTFFFSFLDIFLDKVKQFFFLIALTIQQ